MGKRLDRIDARVTRWMDRTGHPVERWLLGLLFVWFGLLKIAGQTSATSIIAKTIYLGDPEVVVVVLGVWEVGIGVCLLYHRLLRLAIALMLIRLPGTLLALVLKFDECFDGSVLTPTIQGQYLLKDAALLGAALVLGSTVRRRRHG
jgi:uncharacterized membrane protein YphA (DoxX/SURF4 family)